MEELRACPICGAEHFALWKRTRDFAATSEPFEIKRCLSCDFKFTSPRPSPEEVSKYYDFDDYLSHSEDRNGLVSKIYYLARRYAVSWKLNLVRAYSVPQGRTLLDYGCGTGFFAQAAQRAGWYVRGIEPNDQARQLANSRFQDEQAVAAELAALDREQHFDVITLWHVLEHVHSLNQTFADLRKRLKPGGRLIVAVPNIESPDAQHYGEYWAALDVPRHLYHFSANDINRLAATQAGRVVAQLPMYLDAFYISLLSERFRGGWALAAIWEGIKSNLQAFRGRNTSSKVYVISFD